MKWTFKVRAGVQTKNSIIASHSAYRGGRILASSVLLILTLFSISAWAQVTVSPGDIVVTLPNAFGGSGGIVKVNSAGGNQTPIACNPGSAGCPATIAGPGYFQQPLAPETVTVAP